MGRKPKDDQTDWEVIRKEYIYGYQNDDGKLVFPSIRALGKRHEIPWPTIGTYSTKENWTGQREMAISEAKALVGKTLADTRSEIHTDGVKTIEQIITQHIKIHEALMVRFLNEVNTGEIKLSSNSGVQILKEYYNLQKDLLLGVKHGNQQANVVVNNVIVEPPTEKEVNDFYGIHIPATAGT